MSSESNASQFLGKTKGKTDPLPITEAKIKESNIWQMENELYHFARDHFKFMQAKQMSSGKKQDFMYEKIKPNTILSKS
jgi:heparan sulfate 2-O-sulfotransferase HS2ST1